MDDAAGATVDDFSFIFFFRNPKQHALSQIEKARQARPTTTFALDYLFWFAYGRLRLETRLHNVREALGWLDTVPGRLIVGDVPSVEGARSSMLPDSYIPPAEQLGEVNRAIAAWASERPRVVLVPLHAWMQELRGEESVAALPGDPALPTQDLLLFDRMHASTAGSHLLLRRIDRLLEETLPETRQSLLEVPVRR